jgi:hypothetical protein
MTEPDDDDLLAREAALQDEAAAVLVDLDLLALSARSGSRPRPAARRSG